MGPFVDKSNIRISFEAISTSYAGGVLAEVRVSIFKAVSLVAAPAEVTTEFDELLLTKFDLQGVGASLFLSVEVLLSLYTFVPSTGWM